ncbi:hypothetical protein, partial [Mesorhizobium sp. M5C.F.Ca.IN.020.32.2.1]|uniref:hypothetical protein n=1 Tax=Mesorhizobium sp. M5C.F.Ca.IN.020.32.2.1 TaxID=2496771 RepID=UPI0019D46F1B
YTATKACRNVLHLKKLGKLKERRFRRAVRLFRWAAHVAQFLRQNGYSGYASQIIGNSVIPTCAF